MKWIAFGLAALSCAVAPGQTPSKTFLQPHRIRVDHADPWAIKAMLEGMTLRSPEIGVILAGGGPASGLLAGSAASKAMFDTGYLIVNPGDNSLWWIPKGDSSKSPNP